MKLLEETSSNIIMYLKVLQFAIIRNLTDGEISIDCDIGCSLELLVKI